MMLLQLLLLLPAGDLTPVEMTWSEFAGAHYDAALILPTPSAADLDRDGKRTIDLARAMKELARARYAAATEPASQWAASFGDIAAEFRACKGKRGPTDALLGKLEREHADVWRALSSFLPELVRSEALYRDDWDPGDELDDDGLLTAPPWQIKVSPERAAFWNRIDGDRDVCQAAVLIYADLESIKRVEYDYADCKTQPGNQYRQIYPVPGSLVRGKDEAGHDFFSMRIWFENHVPFPFKNVKAELTKVDHFDQDGILLSEVYSTSERFYWLAGRDVLDPVQKSGGELVGYLMVRTTGFDAAGLPDGESDRMKGVRAALGNRKHIAEALFSKRGAKAELVPGKLPSVPMTSWKE